DQAVLAARAGAAGPVRTAPVAGPAYSGTGDVDRWRAGGRRGPADRPAGRRRTGSDGTGVRPAGVPDAAPGTGVQTGRTPGSRVGLDVRRPVDGDRPRTTVTREGRGGSRRTAPDPHRVGRRVPIRASGSEPVMSTAIPCLA